MKFYIVDDEIGIIKTLENIVEIRDIGEIIGYQTDPREAVKEIAALNPDIVLVDLLMSKLDGIALVNEVKNIRSGISFVMISRVTDKNMIEQAYKAGVEFFINKPINVIEIEKVINNVSEKIKMNSIVSNIKGIFDVDEPKQAADKNQLQEINMFLGFLGMLGEKGTGDIQGLCSFLMKNNGSYTKDVLVEYASVKGETPKNIEQRIRRAIKKGLANVASLAIDDYGNEVFQVYSNYVFDFKNIKDEMDCINGKNPTGGRVNISKFIDGLMTYRESTR